MKFRTRDAVALGLVAFVAAALAIVLAELDIARRRSCPQMSAPASTSVETGSPQPQPDTR